MKKSLMLMLFAAGVFALNTTLLGGTLGLTSVSYLPVPAPPGSYIDLFTSVSNEGTFTANGVQCRVESAFPFSLDNENDALRQVGTLAPTQAFLLKFKIRIDENAVPGDNELKFSCKTQSTEWISAKLKIYVQPKDAVLAITSVSVTPEDTEPGARTSIALKLENTAKVYLRDVTVSLSLNDSAIPFAPFEGTSEKRFATIEPGGAVTAEFILASSADAALKVYKLPIVLNYYDSLGKQYTKRDTLGISVSGRPQLLAYPDSDFIKPNKISKLTLRINNAGISDAKFVSVELAPANGLQVLSNTRSYVGTIASDNYESVSFQAIFNQDGTVTIPYTISYKDANNKDYQLNGTASIRVYSPEEALSLGIDSKPDNTLLMAAAGLVALLVFYKLALAVLSFLSKRHAK